MSAKWGSYREKIKKKIKNICVYKKFVVILHDFSRGVECLGVNIGEDRGGEKSLNLLKNK